MKIHRFFTPNTHLEQDLWFKDKTILNQWSRVLRFRPGQQIVLFDGEGHDRLYSLTELTNNEAHLEHITDIKRQVPKKNVYLFWAILKKDKNDWVLQKATELGVSHFIPLLSERCEKTGFNIERARKIVIEAAEQCGRSDIPQVRDAMHLTTAIEQYGDKVTLYICEQGSQETSLVPDNLGVLVGPEGGWSDAEKQLFVSSNMKYLHLHDFTLRAETACITAINKVLG